ncbi:MAG: hypothetical protein JKY08_01805 [Flavobacteriaceae bacterium]|nr:hypothetical protein [Flavobacteriaceae bacterium]
MIQKILTLISRIFIGAFLVFGGVQHFINMEFYLPFVPAFLGAKPFIIYASGIVEIIIGLGLFIPKTTLKASWAYLVLMCLFLPVHVADLFSDAPAIGSHNAAIIRLIVQFSLIALGAYFIRYYQKTKAINHEN